MVKKLLIVFSFILFSTANVYSQVVNYTFSQSVGTYTSITGGTVSGSGATLDDNIYSVTLPNAFNFNGVNITTVGFSPNGYLIMGSTTSHGFIPISNPATSNGIISGLGMDMVSNAASSEMRWQQIGNEIIFQWKEFKRYNSPALTESFSFQIRLNTGTNVINSVYDGSTNIAASIDRIPQVGLRGANNSDYYARRLTTSVPDTNPAWIDTAPATSNAHNVRFTSVATAAYPSAGLTFTWTPPSCFQPTLNTANNITTTNARIRWYTTSPPPALGYQYYYSTSPTPPTSGTTPSGSVSSTTVRADLTGLTANTTYYYWVRSNCSTSEQSAWAGYSTFTTLVVSPNNDLCANATELACGDSLTGTTIGSTNTAHGTGCSMSNYGVWYTFVGNGQQTTINIDATYDIELGIASGTCGALTNLACEDSYGNSENYTFTTNINTTYYLYIAGWSDSSSTTGTFTISRTCTTVAVPSNDDPCNATVAPVNSNLSCASVVPGTIQFASNSGVTSTCGGTRNDDVWYQFTATSTVHHINLNNVSGSTTDLYHAVYSGVCGGLTLIPGTCSDPNNSIVTGLTMGNIYYVQVYSYGNTAENTSFNICIGTPPPPPSNDECSGAIGLTVNNDYSCGTVTAGTTVAATSSPQSDDVTGTPNNDVWFSFIATGTEHRISLINIIAIIGTSTDMGIGVYGSVGGVCGTMTLVGSSDPETYNVTGLTTGTTYFVRVYGWSSGVTSAQTNFNICIGTPPPPPDNDLCANATNLPCGTSNLTGTTNLTSNTPVTIGCSMSNFGVWYTFVGDGDYTTITVDATFDAEIGLASGSCGSFTNLACNDTGNPETYSFVTTNGVTYYVYIAHWSTGNTTTGNFTISRSCETVIVPPNDLCNNATDLSCGTINLAGTTKFTSNIATIGDCYMSNYGVWYTFVGDGDASTISSTSAAGFDHEMSISTGNCVNQESIACEDNAGAAGTETYTFNTTLGVQYYVYIAYDSDYGNTTGSFTISRTCSPPAYCIPSSTDNYYFIDRFSTTGGTTTNITNNGSGFSPGGYGDFTSKTVTQEPGGTINFTLSHGNNEDLATNIWVDWNNDFDFDDPNEKVFASTSYEINQTGSFIVSLSASPGPHRMRVRSAYWDNDPLPCGYEDESETEDYTVIVTPLNCTANPSNLIATVTSTTSANISWTAATPAPGLGYDYLVSTNPSGAPIIASGTITGTSVNVTSLNSGTTYYVFVRGRCNNTDQGYWLTTTLTTGCTNVVTTPTVCPIIIDEQGNNPFTANPFIADPTVDIDCNVPNVTLVANSNLRATTSYIVEQITYPTSPEPEYNFPILGTGAQAINSDDVWASSRTDLGFNFCFYNETFNQTLVGANGMITFDTANTPGSYCGWQFSNNLPSVANDLFEKTIYGVYHDIDPRNITTRVAIKSRTVGAAPCRQFQVSWNAIPMFGDATRLYTGMIVLHETTNIIEVFIKEKRIENGNASPWNGGNAIVGIQGDISPLSPNNQWVAAPCRNGLDTNWETTNEAWRFTPNGAVITPTNITWYQDSPTSGNEVAANGDGSLTVSDGGTYFASVNYSTCSGTVNLVDEIVVTSNRKIWNGSASTNWYKDTNWTPVGTPTATDCVVIPDVSTTSNRSPVVDIAVYGGTIPLPPTATALARRLTVRNNGYLQVNTGTYLEIVDGLTVEPSGEVLIRSTGSLVQTTDVTTNNNTGNIRMQREVLGVVAQNYVYWSSPVEGFNVGNINMAASEPRWQWEPTTADIYGNWATASGNMTVGRGYIVRGLATPPASIPLYNAEFLGRPSNGVINVPITRGNYTGIPYAGASPNTQVTNLDDNWNLVGNPYPSAISGSAFITENATGTTPKIDGIIYLWNHAGLPVGTTGQDPFYGNYVYNYLGSSYVAFNGTGSNPPIFNGSIAAGQSFFVQMEDGAGMNNTVLFNNGMRSVTQANDDFLRTTERHRIWLDLVNSSNEAISTLVGYVMEATNDKDRLYDGNDLNDTPIQFYSLLGTEEMTIQGRALPLDQEDRVPLGFIVPQNANYKIAINSLDGLFADSSQNIYLEDTYLNTIYDLRLNPYEFTSESGTFNDRFILRYTDQALSTPDQVADYDFNIIGVKDYIKVTSGNSPINTVKVYDVLGRLLADYKDVNALEFKFDLINQSEGALIVKATLYNGQQKIKKVIY